MMTATTGTSDRGEISTPPSEASSPPELIQDQRGAVMLTGLFMSCFLIGALWFIVGIGDTLVFRDKMQEAADVGAFSSAALQAKGMNFIALCNLVMLAGTVVHIVLGVISDVKFVIAAACGLNVSCLPELPAKIASFESAYRRWDNYFDKMSKAFKAIHVAQKTASYAYPGLGLAEAYQNGAKYGGDSRTSSVSVFAVSTSLLSGIPAGSVRSPKSRHVKKEGLPVEPTSYGDLCFKVISVGTTGGVNLLQLGRFVSGTNIAGRALMIFNSIVGTLLEQRYCNTLNLHFPPWGPGFDDFWDEDGPFVTYSPADNGSIWFQSWALNVGPKLNDTSESRVGFAARKSSKYTTQEGPSAYYAQAEFYFDCDGIWEAAACNFEENAMYAIKWRARMHRLDLPTLASGIAGAGLAAIVDLKRVKGFKGAIADKIAGAIGGSGLGRIAAKAAARSIVTQLETEAVAAATNQASKLDPSLSKFGVTPYH
jgi:hypothetical protein